MLEGSGQLTAGSGDKRKLSLKSGLALNPAIPQARKPLPYLGQFPHSCAGHIQRRPNSAAVLESPSQCTCANASSGSPGTRACTAVSTCFPAPPPTSPGLVIQALRQSRVRRAEPGTQEAPGACLYMELERPCWNAGQKPGTSVLSRGVPGDHA